MTAVNQELLSMLKEVLDTVKRTNKPNVETVNEMENYIAEIKDVSTRAHALVAKAELENTSNQFGKLPFQERTGPLAKLHKLPDLERQALDKLFAAMIEKVYSKYLDGWFGFADCTEEHMNKLLTMHIRKGDPVDVANFCAFLLFNNQKTREDPEVELLRMQLCACGVCAMTNTEESKEKQRITKDNPYWSASYGDVCRAVDKEIFYRDQLKRLGEIIKECGE